MSTDATVRRGIRDHPRRAAVRQLTNGFRAFYTTLLVGVVVASLLPAVLFQPHSRVFLLKIVAVALLASMPGLLYLEFIRFKGQSLYDEFVINLFRLGIDRRCNLPAPPQHTDYYRVWKREHDALGTDSRDNLYRKKFEAVYGQHAVSTRALFAPERLRPERSEGFFPVLLATVLLCVGWTLVVQPELYRDFDLLGNLPFTGGPKLPVEALQFGFVGTYWFILQDVIRRYFRDDLKTAAYVSASVRIVLVAIVVTTVSLIPAGSPAQWNALAFFIGIFPNVGMQVLKASVDKAFKGVVPSLDSRYPLSDLDGLTIWDQARLLEEGVEDLHGLVTANLVDLLLRTRIPVERLVDWLDQALLCLHLPPAAEDHAPREALRRVGVRTATDLERAWRDRGRRNPAIRKQLADAVDRDGTLGAATITTILESLEEDASFLHVRRFRQHDWLRDVVGSDRPAQG